MCLETLGNTGSVSILCGCVSGSQHVYSPSSSKMLKSLLPSCAFNRRFQKIELTTAPHPSLSLPSFPFAVLQSIFGGKREPLKINHLGLKTNHFQHRMIFRIYMWGWGVTPARVSVGCLEKPVPQPWAQGRAVGGQDWWLALSLALSQPSPKRGAAVAGISLY